VGIWRFIDAEKQQPAWLGKVKGKLREEVEQLIGMKR
jgi:hypothetical protein